MAKTTLEVNDSDMGISIEQKIALMMQNKEPITEGAELLYTERQEGVRAEMNPKSDRFEIACDAMDTANKSKLARRRHLLDEKSKKEKGEETPPTEGVKTTENSGDPSQ